MKRVLLTFGVFVIISLVYMPACVTQQYQGYETYYETEYRMEYKTESYVTTEDVITVVNQGKDVLKPNMQWFNSAISADSVKPVFYYGYLLPATPHSKMDLRIDISHTQSGIVRIYLGGGSIPINPTVLPSYYPYPTEDPVWLGSLNTWLAWLDSLNTWLKTAKLLGTMNLEDKTKDSISFNASDVQEFAIFVDSWDFTAISKVTLDWVDQVVTKQNVTKEKQVPVSVPYQVEKKRLVTKEKQVPVWELPWTMKDNDKK